jgi:hypothetical protein
MKTNIFIILLLILYSCGTEKTIIIEEENEKDLFGSIEGTIIDGITKEPLENVIVSTYPPSTTTLSDEEGYFLLENIKSGQFKLITEKNNYYNKSIYISVNENKTSKAYISLYDLNSQNEAPNKPNILKPVNEELFANYLNLNIEWLGTDPDNNSLTYDVYLDTLNTNMNLLFKDTTSNSIVLKDTLLQDKIYYLKIVSRDIFGEEAQSDLISFKTISLLNDLLLSEYVNFKLDKDEIIKPKENIQPTIINSKAVFEKNRFDEVDKSAFFNGGSYIQVDDLYKLNDVSSFSVSMWIKLNSQSIGVLQNGHTDLFGKFGGTGTGKSSWGIILNSQRKVGFAAYDGKNFTYNYAESIIPTNEWTNIIVVYSKGEVKIYQNGILSITGICSIPQASSNPILIGARFSTPSYFLGYIDDILFYDRVLSLEEIFILRNN